MLGCAGCCQTVSNQSLFTTASRNQGRENQGPLGERSGSAELEIVSNVKSAFQIEIVVYEDLSGLLRSRRFVTWFPSTLGA